jgi:NAD-dependent SIR2 family protein deacetylase
LATGRSRPDATAILRPDGDADLEFVPGGEIQSPICPACGGDLKPRVVFFGGTVDADLVEKIYSFIRTADALLVVGSSLKLFSGYRFCRYAVNHRKPLLIINPDGHVQMISPPLNYQPPQNSPFLGFALRWASPDRQSATTFDY